MLKPIEYTGWNECYVAVKEAEAACEVENWVMALRKAIVYGASTCPKSVTVSPTFYGLLRSWMASEIPIEPVFQDGRVMIRGMEVICGQ